MYLKLGDIGFNFTDNNVIKKIDVDKLTPDAPITGRSCDCAFGYQYWR